MGILANFKNSSLTRTDSALLTKYTFSMKDVKRK